MTDPIVFISRNRIKEGMHEAFKKHYRDSIQLTMVEKPDTLVQLAYINEDASEVTIV